jgi:DHA2 family multidrug resistance protein-like MFS transporter
VALAVVGLGVGVAMTLSVDAIVSAVPHKRAGAASAVSETGYELGGALGIAVLGSLHGLLYRGSLNLADSVSAADEATARESLAATVSQVDSDYVVAHAQNAFAQATEWTALAAAVVLLVAGWVACRVIPSEPVQAPAPDLTPGV